MLGGLNLGIAPSGNANHHDRHGIFFHMCDSLFEDFIVSFPLLKDSDDSSLSVIPLSVQIRSILGQGWGNSRGCEQQIRPVSIALHCENSGHEKNERKEWGHLVLFMFNKTGEGNHLYTVMCQCSPICNTCNPPRWVPNEWLALGFRGCFNSVGGVDLLKFWWMVYSIFFL